MEKAKKARADVALVERGLAESREKAQALIMSGVVYVDEVKVDKVASSSLTSSGFNKALDEIKSEASR